MIRRVVAVLEGLHTHFWLKAADGAPEPNSETGLKGPGEAAALSLTVASAAARFTDT